MINDENNKWSLNDKKFSAFQETKELRKSEQLSEGKVLRGKQGQPCHAIIRGMAFIQCGIGAMLKQWINTIYFIFLGLNLSHYCNKTSDESNLKKRHCSLTPRKWEAIPLWWERGDARSMRQARERDRVGEK